jgi:hypothetical protein
VNGQLVESLPPLLHASSLHPANEDVAEGVAVSVTLPASGPKAKLQPSVDPVVQCMPDGELVTVPLPSPPTVTVSVSRPVALP